MGQSVPSTPRRPASAPPPRVRLHEIRHPYGPCPAALEALQHPAQDSREALAARLRARLAETFRVPSDAIRFLGDREQSLARLVDASRGPLITFPPSGPSSLVARRWPRREHIHLVRGPGPSAMLSVDDAMDLPGDGVAVVDAPSDPLGTLLATADAVRLARACQYLIVDEWCAEFNGRSLRAMALEFENVAIIRSFESWAGLEEARFAWTVMSPRAGIAVEPCEALPAPEVAAAALATLDEFPSVTATLGILREERSRLYRELRKLALFQPLPSWGPFLTARVTMGHRDDVVNALREHGIDVHAPEQSGLERYIRFGLGSRSDMERLKSALRTLTPRLLESRVTRPQFRAE